MMAAAHPHIDSDFHVEMQERENIEDEMQIYVGEVSFALVGGGVVLTLFLVSGHR